MNRLCWRFALLALTAAQNNLTTQREIMNHLLDGYDRSMRPNHPLFSSNGGQTRCSSGGGPDVMNVSPRVIRVHHVDQKDKTFNVDGTTILSWHDWRLNFTALSCVDELNFGSFEETGGIWYPDLVISEAEQERYGGAIGNMAVEGSRVVISRDGIVTWQRRYRVTMGCKTMNFGQLPFDTQFCLVTFLSLRYDSDEITYTLGPFPPNAEVAWSTAEWQVDLHGSRGLAIYQERSLSTLRLCMRFVRLSNSDALAITVAIFLVCAAYSGFYVSANAAPARISLAFLCFLMVLNNLNTILDRLPPLKMPKGPGERIWINDFLFGTMVFNFVPLLEYAAINYGMYCAALKKEKAASAVMVESPPMKLAGVVIGSTRLQLVRSKWDPSCLVDLDKIFRWLFPLCYLIYLIAMFSLNSSYGEGVVDCDYESRIS